MVARAILSAVVVVHALVGISVILPPLVFIGLGGVIVWIAAVPAINVMGVVGVIVVAELIVGAGPNDVIRPTVIAPLPVFIVLFWVIIEVAVILAAVIELPCVFIVVVVS